MSEMPERIWAWEVPVQVVCRGEWDTPDDEERADSPWRDKMQEYTRADIAEARIAELEAALRFYAERHQDAFGDIARAALTSQQEPTHD